VVVVSNITTPRIKRPFLMLVSKDGKTQIMIADDSESSQQEDIITINVRAIEREIENYGTVGFDTFLTDSLDEEIIHLLTVKLASEEDISNIAKELSKEDRQKVTDYYFSKTNDPDETLRDRSIAMEYVRMVLTTFW
jgi:hypothetical protein